MPDRETSGEEGAMWVAVPGFPLRFTVPMPTLARFVVVGETNHATQRENAQQDVFFEDDDRRVYLRFLRASNPRMGNFLGESR